MAQQSGDRDGIATTLNNIANVYVGKGDIGRTMEYYIAAGRAFDSAGHSLSAVVVPPNWWLYAEVVHCAAAAE
jgi:hypothetical protein